MTVTVGSKAPAFYAATPTMKPVTDADFAGKKVVLAFFPAAFSGSPEEGCEMQLCGLGSVVASSPDTLFYGVSGDLPFSNAAFAKKIDLPFPLLSDPTLATCERYVGKCDFGKFLGDAGVTDALPGAVTSNRGCVVIDENGVVVYAFSGEGHPGKMPPLAEIKKALGLE